MLDGFHELHRRRVFRDRIQTHVNDLALSTAETAAAKDLALSDRAFLNGNGSLERHHLLYESRLELEMDAYKDLSCRIDRRLVESIILYKLLQMEEVSTRNDTLSVDRSKSILGWMIQERLIYVLLQTGNNSFARLMDLRWAYGMEKDSWEMRLVGAAAEAKAMIQLSRVKELRLYPATLFEDVGLGIDFFLEAPGGTGLCVSVKTDVDGHTRFLLKSAPGYEQAWNRIEIGSQNFCQYAKRNWRPILLLMGKTRGKNFRLKHKAERVPGWVVTLESILNASTTNGNLILTT